MKDFRCQGLPQILYTLSVTAIDLELENLDLWSRIEVKCFDLLSMLLISDHMLQWRTKDPSTLTPSKLKL